MNVNKNKTLEELEKSYWGFAPDGVSFLVTRIHQIRKKTLNDLTIEDLRITIGQNLSLELLIPIAIDILKQNILAEGDLYEGDLLQNVFNLNIEFWKDNYDYWFSIKQLFETNKRLFDEREHRQILKSFKRFEEIHYGKH